MNEIEKRMIIRNCPSNYQNNCRTAKVNKYNCQDCTDCMMKRIVELCKETCRKRCTNDCLGTKKYCGYGQILKLLDIEEVNEFKEV